MLHSISLTVNNWVLLTYPSIQTLKWGPILRHPILCSARLAMINTISHMVTQHSVRGPPISDPTRATLTLQMQLWLWLCRFGEIKSIYFIRSNRLVLIIVGYSNWRPSTIHHPFIVSSAPHRPIHPSHIRKGPISKAVNELGAPRPFSPSSTQLSR